MGQGLEKLMVETNLEVSQGNVIEDGEPLSRNFLYDLQLWGHDLVFMVYHVLIIWLIIKKRTLKFQAIKYAIL